MSAADKIRELAASGTPSGRWHWNGNAKYKAVALCSWMPGLGRVTIMDFVRAGMQGAQPRFRDENVMMVDSMDLVQFEVCHAATSAHDPRVYRHDIDDIRHPDARKIVVAVNALPAIADLIGDLSTHSKLAARCYECDRAWPCATAVARDALIEALEVTE
jgi:hypothetical protein